MSLSSRLEANYAELANQYLDSIPVEKEEEFEIVREALLSITEPSRGHNVASSLRDRVTAIKEIVEEPEMYVQGEENYPEFQRIIMHRVAAKIQEIDTLKPEEKRKYIESQKEQRENASQNQAVMAGREREPSEEGSEAHVISREEWLREEQDRFPRETADHSRGTSIEPIDYRAAEEFRDSLRELQSHDTHQLTPVDMLQIQIRMARLNRESSLIALRQRSEAFGFQ